LGTTSPRFIASEAAITDAIHREGSTTDDPSVGSVVGRELPKS
jgi:hypothetical protein